LRDSRNDSKNLLVPEQSYRLRTVNMQLDS